MIDLQRNPVSFKFGIKKNNTFIYVGNLSIKNDEEMTLNLSIEGKDWDELPKLSA